MSNLITRAAGAALWAKLALPVGTAVLVVLGLFLGLPLLLMGGIDDETTSGQPVSVGISDAVPAEYREAIMRAGSVCDGITPSILAAQIEAESNWNPTAVSPVGAAGLTQFMPDTWRAHGKDGDGDGKAQVLNPFDAIKSQGDYMCLLKGIVQGYLDRGLVTGNVIDLTLAAYNAGQGNVLTHRGIPPFAETRTYVEKINRLAATKYTSAQLVGDVSTQLVAYARTFLGLPYVWGANGPDAFDCSGFTKYVYAHFGIDIPRYSEDQANAGRHVSEAEAKPGDLMWWPGHVAIYAGNGTQVHAANPSVGLVETPVRPGATFVRILPDATYTGAKGTGAIVDAAKKYLGRPYRGEGPGGIDCCVFVQAAVRDATGIELPLFTPGNPSATAKCEWSMQNRASEFGGIQIPADLATLQPGDLLFHQSTSVDPAYDSVTHVSIYIGNGQLIDSAPGVGVAIHSIDYYSQTDPILPIAVRFVLAA